MKTSEKLDQLLPALTKARQHFQEIKKSKTNPHYKSKYAALDDILPAIVPALAAEGLLLIGDLCNGQEGIVTVTTRLMHISEQWIESRVDLSYQFGNLQKLGGEVTYTRRYSINTMLQLAADDDLDEQAPPQIISRRSSRPTVEPPPDASLTAEELKALSQLAEGAGLDTVKFGDDMRLLLELAPGAKLTRKFLCETMTREQYEERWQRYTDLIEANQDTDVPDFSGPPEATETVVAGEGQDAEHHATVEQLDGLEDLAREISDAAVEEVQRMRRVRHGQIELALYHEVRNRLSAQKETRLTAAKVY